jgi:hypothetical protein
VGSCKIVAEVAVSGGLEGSDFAYEGRWVFLLGSHCQHGGVIALFSL